MLDGLPGGALDELQLGDVRLGRSATAVFRLVNRTEGKAFRWGGRRAPSLAGGAIM
jgi:hypothetical protein